MNEKQENCRMNVRMHILDESKIEMQEMPQLWKGCKDCQDMRRQGLTDHPDIPTLMEKCCIKCGCLNSDAIKEPRFMKNTHHLSPLHHFKQMCKDQKAISRKILNLNVSRIATYSSDADSLCEFKSINSENEDFMGEYLPVEQKFVQEIREEAVIKILESGVRLCLKL